MKMNFGVTASKNNGYKKSINTASNAPINK